MLWILHKDQTGAAAPHSFPSIDILSNWVVKVRKMLFNEWIVGREWRKKRTSARADRVITHLRTGDSVSPTFCVLIHPFLRVERWPFSAPFCLILQTVNTCLCLSVSTDTTLFCYSSPLAYKFGIFLHRFAGFLFLETCSILCSLWEYFIVFILI